MARQPRNESAGRTTITTTSLTDTEIVAPIATDDVAVDRRRSSRCRRSRSRSTTRQYHRAAIRHARATARGRACSTLGTGTLRQGFEPAVYGRRGHLTVRHCTGRCAARGARRRRGAQPATARISLVGRSTGNASLADHAEPRTLVHSRRVAFRSLTRRRRRTALARDGVREADVPREARGDRSSTTRPSATARPAP